MIKKTILITSLITCKLAFSGDSINKKEDITIEEKIKVYESNTNVDLSSLESPIRKCITNSLKSMMNDFVDLDNGYNSRYLKSINRDCENDILPKTTKSENTIKEKSRVKVLSSYNFSSDQIYSDEQFGGLSGITYSENTNELMIISDDFGRFGTPRMFKFSLEYKRRKFKIEFQETIKIKDKENNVLEYAGYSNGFDSEGIIDLGSENGYLVSTETYFNNSFLHQIKGGKIVGGLSIPDTYNPHNLYKYMGQYSLTNVFNIPTAKKPSKLCKTLYVLKLKKWDCDLIKRDHSWFRKIEVSVDNNSQVSQFIGGGIAHNVGIEGLTITPSKERIFFTTERSLKQDNPSYDFENDYSYGFSENSTNDNLVRIVMYSKKRNKFGMDNRKEFAYQYENRKGNGISEILAISDDKLLVMERGYDSRLRKTTVKIFEINLKRAKDIKNYQSLKNLSKDYILEKELLVDLDHIKDQFKAGFRKVDNFEAMTLGPKLRNGKKSIILATDNNFRGRQLTQLIILQTPFR